MQSSTVTKKSVAYGQQTEENRRRQERLVKYEEKDEFSDIVLVVEGKRLHVNKTLLMMHSPEFKTMFTAYFREKDLQEIPLPEKKVDLVVELLDQIYPGYTTDKFHDETLRDLLQLADEYGVQQVFHNCRAYFDRRINCKNKSMKIDEILLFLGIVEEWSKKYNQLSLIRSALIEQASQVSTHSLKTSEYYSSVPATAQRDILMRRLEGFEILNSE
ncbi:BTB and MATH domain-containing protein 36-like [Pomacea canaliculata]|uniref:BTB and MATH domain-containing protein 36-like n=1 Tax=Pomacea canaliculata TaxID=400727 RepID=UPI000D73DBFF|nr:BTB and MATH domain-containing protein 36-like [Pomacea canaliculata]